MKAPAVERVEISAYRVPTDAPEADGTLCWEATRLLVAEAVADGARALGLGYDAFHFRDLLTAGAADVLQADATRWLGVTGFLRAGMLCEALCLPLAAHTAPTLHAHLCCALPAARHVEHFHDHARIEAMLFDGALEAGRGRLAPDRDRPGLGLELRRQEAEPFRVSVGGD